MSERGVRVMQLTVEMPIGDAMCGPALRHALAEYVAACQAGELGHEQDEVFYSSRGAKVVARHFYRNEVSRDFWPTIIKPRGEPNKPPVLVCLDGGGDASCDG